MSVETVNWLSHSKKTVYLLEVILQLQLIFRKVMILIYCVFGGCIPELYVVGFVVFWFSELVLVADVTVVVGGVGAFC